MPPGRGIEIALIAKYAQLSVVVRALVPSGPGRQLLAPGGFRRGL